MSTEGSVCCKVCESLRSPAYAYFNEHVVWRSGSALVSIKLTYVGSG